MLLSFKSDCLKFVKTLNPKHAKQIFIKCLELCDNAFPHDSKALAGGLKGKHRVDSGEYRIIYIVEDELITVLLIGKRNDDAVYKQALRLN